MFSDPILELLAASGRNVPMPGASGPIRSVMLHLDERTRARTLAVEFPAGFARPVAGRYRAGEELLVLSGELELDGMRLEPGDWAWLPPGLLRRRLSSRGGAVVYAWFSAGNDYEPSDRSLPGCPPARSERVGTGDASSRPLRDGGRGDGPGRSAIVSAGEEVTGPADVLMLDSLAWSRLEAGDRVLTGPRSAFVRWTGPEFILGDFFVTGWAAVTEQIRADLVRIGGFTHPLFVQPSHATAPLPGQGLLLLMGGLVEQTGRTDEAIALLGIREARFRRPAEPGTRLRVLVEVVSRAPRSPGRDVCGMRRHAGGGAGATLAEAFVEVLVRKA